MSKSYKVRPSQLLDIDDNYVAYCFDEACLYIIQQLEDKKTPKFNDGHKGGNKGLAILMAGEK